MLEVNNITNQLKKNGSIKVEKFIDQNEVDVLKKIVLDVNKDFHHPDTYFSTNLKSLSTKLLKFQFKKLFDSLKLIELSKKKQLNLISRGVYEKKEKLHMIDGYVAKKSQKNIIDWHCDAPYKDEINSHNRHDNRSLKFFIYLTDVDKDNGCLAYIPRSHKVVYKVKKMIYEKKIAQGRFQFLNECRDFILQPENYNIILREFGNDSEIKEFLDQTKFICEDREDTNEFDYSLKAGDALIFDENGFHRGGKPKFNDRVVLRYHYGIH
tara:strand:+ start:2597 stop:3397 length:801 start_codon:yes stop_codon:yes gene_type:complete